MYLKTSKIIHGLLIGAVCFSTFFNVTSAQSVDVLRDRINARNNEIKALENEIALYQSQLQRLSNEKADLQRALQEIEISRKKLLADISLTEEKIGSTDLTIQKLSLEVEEKERRIAQNRRAIALALQKIDEYDNESMVEAFFSRNGISEFWAQMDRLTQFQSSVKRDLDLLKTLQTEVEKQRQEAIAARKLLVDLRSQLEDKRMIVEQERKQQASLVAQTQNKESEYQKIVSQKQAQKQQFEQELFSLESELQIAIDPSKLPETRSGVLAWPLDSITITQRFGRTVAAQTLYVSGTHNGVDFRASVGTPLKAALSGVVEATGNTDLQRGCYSYGKWVLIRHNNGLSTMYAHMSLVNVTQGQVVTTGDIIGYTGNTGYATGPHLHFTVYATEGVRIQQYTSSINCKQTFIPIADQQAYLDPLQYLPAL